MNPCSIWILEQQTNRHICNTKIVVDKWHICPIQLLRCFFLKKKNLRPRFLDVPKHPGKKSLDRRKAEAICLPQLIWLQW